MEKARTRLLAIQSELEGKRTSNSRLEIYIILDYHSAQQLVRLYTFFPKPRGSPMSAYVIVFDPPSLQTYMRKKSRSTPNYTTL